MIRQWIKIHTLEYLDGSIRKDLEPAERSVWTDMIVLAGLSRNDDGRIERSKGIPFSVDEMAKRFSVDIELVQSTVDKCIKEGRVLIDTDGTFVIANWHKYQSHLNPPISDNGNKPKVAISPLIPPLSDYQSELENKGKLAKLTARFPDEAQRLVEEANKTPEFKDMVKNTLREIKK